MGFLPGVLRNVTPVAQRCQSPPSRIGGAREDHPDQEEGQYGLDHDRSAGADSHSERRHAEIDGIDAVEILEEDR